MGAKYGKSSTQAALRFLIQSDVVVIPKSTHRERMAQDLEGIQTMEILGHNMAYFLKCKEVGSKLVPAPGTFCLHQLHPEIRA